MFRHPDTLETTWKNIAIDACNARGNSDPKQVNVNIQIDKTAPEKHEVLVLWSKDITWVHRMVHAISKTLAVRSEVQSGGKLKWVSILKELHVRQQEALQKLYQSQGEVMPKAMDEKGHIPNQVRDALRFCMYILFGEALLFKNLRGQGWHVLWGSTVESVDHPRKREMPVAMSSQAWKRRVVVIDDEEDEGHDEEVAPSPAAMPRAQSCREVIEAHSSRFLSPDAIRTLRNPDAKVLPSRRTALFELATVLADVASSGHLSLCKDVALFIGSLSNTVEQSESRRGLVDVEPISSDEGRVLAAIDGLFRTYVSEGRYDLAEHVAAALLTHRELRP